MTIVLKCHPGRVSDGLFVSEPVPVAIGCTVDTGEEVFVWWTHEGVQEGLALRGTLIAAEQGSNRAKSLTVSVDGLPQRRLTKSDLARYDERKRPVPDHPMRDLCRTLLAHSLRRVAPLSEREANYLRDYFVLATRAARELEIEADLVAIKSQSGITETQRQQLVLARLGQGRFRHSLLDHWHGCAVTGCELPDLLRASHIKPWKNSSNQERLDPYNGLILIATLDAAFDRGLVSFQEDGSLIFSKSVPVTARRFLGVGDAVKITLAAAHQPYLAHHRSSVFRP